MYSNVAVKSFRGYLPLCAVNNTSIPNCRPCWTMSLSGPSLLQNARSASRRSVSQVGTETFPNWVSRSVQMASRGKDGRSKSIFKTPRPPPDGPQVGPDVEFGTLSRTLSKNTSIQLPPSVNVYLLWKATLHPPASVSKNYKARQQL